ncbi:hypothetical protein D5S17_22880 [Pseudonocardiaceae bacterium YIM PH 21723]|nr:hypothetical protein D5S17_22880 [Pseudonocardiaceae bacterium YIM PH 21723]
MQWTTFLATFVGAAIAGCAALLAQSRKGRHELLAEGRQTRREVYMRLQSSLAKARSELLALSKLADLAGRDRDELARQLFAPCYEPRHHLELIAPPEVTDPALIHFRSVRTMRDLVCAGKGVTDPEWLPNKQQIKATLDAMRLAMRQDLERL